jgi:hypothetical protein
MLKKLWNRLLLLAIPCAAAPVCFWTCRPKELDEEKPFHRIEDGLYLGSSVANPPPHTSAVLNLCALEDQDQVDAMLCEPVLDGGKLPDVDWLKRVVGFVDAQRRARRTV